MATATTRAISAIGVQAVAGRGLVDAVGLVGYVCSSVSSGSSGSSDAAAR